MDQINESFDAVDEEKTGFVTDKDHIYALFLSLGVTFDSEEDFNEAIAIAIDSNDTKPEPKGTNEESKDAPESSALDQ